ncbi:MAG: hypothetical protein U0234_00830 [Sandaracinus sp.]
MRDARHEARALARRVGWTSLAAWALVGMALEAAHGLKLSSYLDDALTRELCTLAHAHGVGLALVTIVVGELGLPRLDEAAARWVARAVAACAVAIPASFLLATIGHGESDPGIAIWAVPVAALTLVVALARIAGATFAPADEEKEEEVDR